jgi:hypothetical protein
MIRPGWIAAAAVIVAIGIVATAVALKFGLIALQNRAMKW